MRVGSLLKGVLVDPIQILPLFLSGDNAMVSFGFQGSKTLVSLYFFFFFPVVFVYIFVHFCSANPTAPQHVGSTGQDSIAISPTAKTVLLESILTFYFDNES